MSEIQVKQTQEVRKRGIITTIDDIVAMCQSYCRGTGDIPPSTKAISLQINPANKGKLRIVCESPDWAEGLPTILVHFELRRFLPVSTRVNGKIEE
jgi:hypothetical protein